MDAQGRGQDSWFEAGKPWDPHWIQAGTKQRLRGLPSSCPAGGLDAPQATLHLIGVKPTG